MIDNNKQLKKTIALLILGGCLYFVLLWNSLSVWIFDYILIPISSSILTDMNLNIATGMLYSLLWFVVLVLLFLTPYIIFSVFILVKMIKKNKN